MMNTCHYNISGTDQKQDQRENEISHVGRYSTCPTCRLGKRCHRQGTGRDIRTGDLKIVVSLQRSSRPWLTPESSGHLVVLLIVIWYMYKASLHTVICKSETLKTTLGLQLMN